MAGSEIALTVPAALPDRTAHPGGALSSMTVPFTKPAISIPEQTDYPALTGN